jgi:hypothetical protein
MERGALKKQLDIQLDDGKRREVPPRNIWIFRLTVERGERCLQETFGFSDLRWREERGASKKQLAFQLDDGKRREMPPRNSWRFSLTVERGERGLQETVGFSDCLTEERDASKKKLAFQLDYGERCLQETVGFSA